MRLFKPTKKAAPAVVEQIPASQGFEAPPAEEVIDIEEVIRTFEERDDAAPIAAPTAPRVDVTNIDFKDVTDAPVSSAKSPGLFGGMFSSKSAKPVQASEDAAPLELAAAPGVPDAPATPRQRKKLFFGLKPAVMPRESDSGTVSDLETPPEVTGVDAYVPAADEPLKARGRFASSFRRKAKNANEVHVVAEVPIKVIVGYLPDVTARDAGEFAQGVAGKHIDNLGIAYFDAFKVDKGFAYEVHEGGNGRAYLPDILKYFASLGAFSTEDANKVHIRTATRTVEVSRQRDGLSAVLLPEAQKPAQPAWLRTTVVMRPALNKRTGLLVAGASIFVTGFIAMLFSGTFARYQPYEEAAETLVEKIDYNHLPISQYDLQIAPAIGNKFIKALKFEGGQWKLEVESLAPSTPAVPAEPTVPSTPPLVPGQKP